MEALTVFLLVSAELCFIDSLRCRVNLFYLFHELSSLFIFNLCCCYLYNPFNQICIFFISILMYKGRLEYEKSLDQTKITNASRHSENPGDELQKQIQSYTRKFEEEKRKLFRAQENHRQILKDYQNQISDLQGLKTKKYQTEICSLSAKIKGLELNLQKGITAYNEALSMNNTLKSEIDELRKDKKNQKQALRTLTHKIEEYNSSINHMDQSIQQKKSKVQIAKRKILEVRQTNKKQNIQYSQYVKKLKDNENLRQTLRNVVAKQATEASDTQPIVKLRIRNLIHQNKEKIRIADLYKKGMEKISQSFQEIKEESGIYDLQQITKTFLKQEEQNTMIFQYINKLTTQLELICEENEGLKSQIQKRKEIVDQYRDIMGGTPQQQRERTKIESYCVEKMHHIDKFNSFLQAIEPSLLETLKIEKKQKQSILSYSNVENLLALLEEMIEKKCQNNQDSALNSQGKDDFTKYSRPLPAFLVQEQKDKGEESIMDHSKFRDYASDFWEKKRQTK